MRRFMCLVLLAVMMLNISVLSVSAYNDQSYCWKHKRYYSGSLCESCIAQALFDATGEDIDLTIGSGDGLSDEERWWGYDPAKGEEMNEPEEYFQAPRDLVAQRVIQPIPVLAPSRR